MSNVLKDAKVFSDRPYPASEDIHAEFKAAHGHLDNVITEVERLTGLLGQSMVGHTVKDTTIDILREQAERLHELHGDTLITIAMLREALERAHACATLKNDGTCLGCFISVALAATEVK